MKRIYHFIVLLGLIGFLSSGCSNEQVAQAAKGLPTAFGNINQVVVVGDDGLFKGMVGDTFDYYFAAPYIILPQPEPIYDLKYFNPDELKLDELKRQFKSYIIVADLADEDSPTTELIKKDIGAERQRQIKETDGYTVTVGRNKWAYGQTLIYIVGYGEENLVKSIRNNFPVIAKKINEEQVYRIKATAYQGGENESLGRELESKMGVKLKVPSDYFKAIYDEDTNTMWMRRETRKLSANIMVHKMSYTDENQLSQAGLKEVRDFLGKKYVSTTTDGTWMRTNDEDLPMFVEQRNVNDYYALEARGIWDIVNDFMGGPFMSLLIHNPETNELLFIDGFIHAPGEEKRNPMQEIEQILATVEF